MKRKQIISGVSTVLCTTLVLGLSACGGKTNTPQTIPAVNDTVKETAKDSASDTSRELDAVSEKDASTKQIYDDRLITDAASLEDHFKDYHDMVIELVGPDSSPVLFLLTEQNTVEFVRILDSAAYGTMVSSGPAYGIGAAGDLDPDPPELVGFEAGMNETGGTVYILCDNGERFDLSIELGSSRERFPADLCAAWEASLFESEKQTTYNLAILSYDTIGELVFCDTAADYYVEYQGMLDCLGMDETGLLYGYTLTGPDGNDLYGTFSLLPRYGTLRAGIVGGENLFEKTGYLEFEEVSG